MRTLCLLCLLAVAAAVPPLGALEGAIGDTMRAIDQGVRDATGGVLATVAELGADPLSNADEYVAKERALLLANLFEEVFREYTAQRGVTVPSVLTTYDRFADPEAVPEHCTGLRYGRLLVLRCVRLWVETHVAAAQQQFHPHYDPDRRLPTLVKKLESIARRVCEKHNASGLFNALIALSSNDAMFAQNTRV